MANKNEHVDVSSTKDRELSITRLLNAPRNLVWEVFTNPEHIKLWWGPHGFTNTIHTMEVKANGKWSFIMHGPDGTDYKNENIFAEVIQPEKIVFDHVSAPKHRTTIVFEEQGNKTLLHFTMVFATVEIKEQTVKTFKADIGLNQNIDKLETYLKRETTNKATPFIIERVYNAPIEKVWSAITDNDEMKKWYFDITEFKAEPGFEFTFNGGSKDMTYVHLCKVKEVIPGKKLSYSWKYKDYQGDSLVTFELFAEGDKTKLVLTHEGLETFPQNNPDFAKASFEKGWTYITGTSLKNYVEAV
jgi:uncharacterized protein YndB with AHSA1/START domain